MPRATRDLPRKRRDEAAYAVWRLARNALDASREDYDTALAGRRLLADVASGLERRRCLTDLVPWIDRALRLIALPDAETYPQEESQGDYYDYDEEPTYGR